MSKISWFDFLSLALFLFVMGGNIAVALISWLLFTLLLKPDDWSF